MSVTRTTAARAMVLTAGTFVLLALWSSEPARAEAGEVVALESAVQQTAASVAEVTNPLHRAAAPVERTVGGAATALRDTVDEVATSEPAMVERVPAPNDPVPEVGSVPERSTSGGERRDRAETRLATPPVSVALGRVPMDTPGKTDGIAPRATSGEASVGLSQNDGPSNTPTGADVSVASFALGSLVRPEPPVAALHLWPLLLAPALAHLLGVPGRRPHHRARAVPSLPG